MPANNFPPYIYIGIYLYIPKGLILVYQSNRCTHDTIDTQNENGVIGPRLFVV